METITELEEKLRIAKNEVFYKKALDIYNLHKPIEGKCFSSHVLNGNVLRSSHGGYINLNAIKVLEIYMSYNGDNKIESVKDIGEYQPKVYGRYEVIEVRLAKDGKHNFSISEETRIVPVEGCRREVDSRDYEKLKNYLISQFQTILSKGAISEFDPKVRPNFVEGYDKVVTMKKYGYSFIDLTSEEYFELNRWHPYVYGQKLLVSYESKAMLESMIEEMREKDSNDVDTFFMGERIRRHGNYGRILEILNRINNKL